MLTIYIVKDANRRMVMLHAAAKFTSDKVFQKKSTTQESVASWTSLPLSGAAV